MRRKPGRWLGVGTDRYRWTLAHAHEPGPTHCREIVRMQRENSPGRLVITFGSVAGGYPLHAGQVVHADRRGLNLNQPGVARALLDEAVARGWQPEAKGVTELDGWALFDAAFAAGQAPGSSSILNSNVT